MDFSNIKFMEIPGDKTDGVSTIHINGNKVWQSKPHIRITFRGQDFKEALTYNNTYITINGVAYAPTKDKTNATYIIDLDSTLTSFDYIALAKGSTAPVLNINGTTPSASYAGGAIYRWENLDVTQGGTPYIIDITFTRYQATILTKASINCTVSIKYANNEEEA